MDFSDILLTVDFDRTLTAPDSTIPQRNIEAIRWFMDQGGAFTVNTGRSVPMTNWFRDQVPVNVPLLLYNGSAAYDVATGEWSQCYELDLDPTVIIPDLQGRFPDLTVEVQALDKHYNFIPNPAWDAFSANNCAYGTAEDGQDLGPFLKFAIYGEIRDVTVNHLFSGTEEEIRRMDEAEAMLRETYGEDLAIFRAGPRVIDVQVAGISKCRAARELQQKLGRKILVCAGDAENDVVMLDGADYAFVPADAILKDRYENVCKCADGAVADVIYEKIPKILNLDLDKKG